MDNHHECEPTGHPALVCTLIHGTWARNASWTLRGSKLRNAIGELAPGRVCFDRFVWSGANSHTGRRQAACDLGAQLRGAAARHQGVPHIVIAHSHGGNVLAAAFDQEPELASEISAVVTLGTPFLSARRRTVEDAGAVLRWPTAFLGMLIGICLTFLLFCALAGGVMLAWGALTGHSVGLTDGVALLLLAIFLPFGMLGALAGMVSGWERWNTSVPRRATALRERLAAELPSQLLVRHLACYFTPRDEALFALTATRAIADAPVWALGRVMRGTRRPLLWLMGLSILATGVGDTLISTGVVDKGWRPAFGAWVAGAVLLGFALVVITYQGTLMAASVGRLFRGAYGLGIGLRQMLLVDVVASALPQNPPADTHIVRVGTPEPPPTWRQHITGLLTPGELFHSLHSDPSVLSDLTSWLRGRVLPSTNRDLVRGLGQSEDLARASSEVLSLSSPEDLGSTVM